METNKERKITYRLDLPLHQRHRHHDVRLLDLRRPTQPEPHAERQQQLALRPEQQHFVAIQHLAEDQPYVPVDPKPIALESKYENGSIYNRYFCLILFPLSYRSRLKSAANWRCRCSWSSVFLRRRFWPLLVNGSATCSTTALHFFGFYLTRTILLYKNSIMYSAWGEMNIRLCRW